MCGPDIAGKTFVVTGPTSGIGTTTAETLARLGARVILACRTVSRGEALVARWRETAPEGAPHLDCEVMHLDLDSLGLVRAFAAAFVAKSEPLHCLINNAGVFDMSGAHAHTKDGHEQHYGTNYLAPVLLTLELMPALRLAGAAEAPARVVFVCSKLHEFCPGLRLDDLAFARRPYGARARVRAEQTRRAALRAGVRAPPGRRSGWRREGRGGAMRSGASGKHRHGRGSNPPARRADRLSYHHGVYPVDPGGGRAGESVRCHEEGGDGGDGDRSAFRVGVPENGAQRRGDGRRGGESAVGGDDEDGRICGGSPAVEG